MLGRFVKLFKRSLVWWSGLVLLALVVYVLFFWQLGTLTRGFSPAETAARTASSSPQAIIDNPVNAPHKILEYTAQKVPGNSAFNLRATSVVFALLFLIGFYQLVGGWFGKMIGFFSTVFLAASPWFVLLARSATAAILLLTPIAIIAAYNWLKRRRNTYAFTALLTLSAIGLYVPGVIWLVMIGLIFSRKKIKPLFAALGRIKKTLVFLPPAFLILPLVYASVKNTNVVQDLLLIPDDWLSPLIYIKSLAWNTLALFWRTPSHIDIIIGRLPMLNLAQTILVLFGTFALWRLARNKFYILISTVFFAAVAAVLKQDLVFLTLALPALAIATAAGLRYLYLEWRKIFPKNPIPKYLAIFLVSALTILHVIYGVRYSLVAWPNSSATRDTYVLK